MPQTFQDRDSLEQCPYDPSHFVRRLGFANHIFRCAKNHPNSKKVRCPFNVTHLIDPAVFAHHLEHCESAGTVYNAIYATEPERTVGTVSLEEACANQPRFLNEDWEGGHSSYDPAKHTENRDIIRMVQCVPKKERNAHKFAERQRRAALEKHNNNVTVPKVEEPEQPLRRPKTMPKTYDF